jgi:hypothetical protein
LVRARMYHHEPWRTRDAFDAQHHKSARAHCYPVLEDLHTANELSVRLEMV